MPGPASPVKIKRSLTLFTSLLDGAEVIDRMSDLEPTGALPSHRAGERTWVRGGHQNTQTPTLFGFLYASWTAGVIGRLRLMPLGGTGLVNHLL